MSAVSESAAQKTLAVPPPPRPRRSHPAAPRSGGQRALARRRACPGACSCCSWLFGDDGLSPALQAATRFGVRARLLKAVCSSGSACSSPVGLIAALVVALGDGTGRATSLRTRSFFVIAVAVLIPALCLSGARSVGLLQELGHRRRLSTRARRAIGHRSSVGEISRAWQHAHALSPAEQRARLSRRSSTSTARKVTPPEPSSATSRPSSTRALTCFRHGQSERFARKGFAIGTWEGPTGPRRCADRRMARPVHDAGVLLHGLLGRPPDVRSRTPRSRGSLPHRPARHRV